MNVQKWSNRKRVGMLMAVVSLGSALLLTDAMASRHDARQHRQRSRIRDGVKSGELTHQEAGKLRSEQRKIRRMEKRIESDGTVTTREKIRLENRQDKASGNIRDLKTNDDQRPRGNDSPSDTSPDSSSGS